MKKANFLFSVLFLFSGILYAQDLVYKNYVWDENPSLHTIDESLIKEHSAVIVKDYTFSEYYESRGELNTYKTIHNIIHVNSDAGIEKYNKIYIPMQGGSEIVDLKVRSISADGKVTTIQRDNIKELENVKGISNVKIFAMEGLEVGGEAEYCYTLKLPIRFFGIETLQTDDPILDGLVQVYYPDNWILKYKTYNNLEKPTVQRIGKKNCLIVHQKNIPAFVEEEYALKDPLKLRFEYKVHSNGRYLNMFSWYNIFKQMMINYSDTKAAGVAAKFVKDIKNQRISDEEKIIALENKIKSTIRLEKRYDKFLGSPKEIVKGGFGNATGLMRLYIYCLDALEIDNTIVVGCNRMDGHLENDFANPVKINEVFIYFPKYDKYLLPEHYHMRYGGVHTGLIDTKAFFISYYIENNKLKKSTDKFKKIEGLSYEVNKVGVNATIDFSDNLALPNVSLEDFCQGYRAFAYRSAFKENNEKGFEEDFIKNTIMTSYKNYNLKDFQKEGENIELSSNPENYYRMKVNFTTPELVEKAGNEYLISVGKIIGKQSELYQEKERQHDITSSTITNYNHTITINIPKGYKLEGLENIKIDNELVINNEALAFFKSNYTKNASSVTITVNKVYKTLHFPKEKYPEFRKVINSAANFNKLTLVLVKNDIEQ